tara:strand:- start:4207 stop:4425 length:219 start_codon:yes stop_codon:yes gene_type:complete
MELNFKVKKDKEISLLKQLLLRTIPRVGEKITYEKITYEVIDIEYNVPITGEETVNVVLAFLFSHVQFESPE